MSNNFMLKIEWVPTQKIFKKICVPTCSYKITSHNRGVRLCFLV